MSDTKECELPQRGVRWLGDPRDPRDPRDLRLTRPFQLSNDSMIIIIYLFYFKGREGGVVGERKKYLVVTDWLRG